MAQNGAAFMSSQQVGLREGRKVSIKNSQGSRENVGQGRRCGKVRAGALAAAHQAFLLSCDFPHTIWRGRCV